MKCSFKTVQIHLLLVIIVMTLAVWGSLAEKSDIGGRLNESKEPFHHLVEDKNHALSLRKAAEDRTWKRVRKYLPYNKLSPMKINQDGAWDSSGVKSLTGRPIVKVRRNKVSLTRIPSGISRRTEEGTLISQTNNHILGSRVPIRNLRKSRQRRWREAPQEMRLNDCTDTLTPDEKKAWCSRAFPKLGLYQEEYDPSQPCGNSQMFGVQMCPDKSTAFCTEPPKTYMVRVEKVDDEDCQDDPCSMPKAPLCDKYYYVFEKRPFKVKFVNIVNGMDNECNPGIVCDNAKLSMPAFQCTPPECREVLYCNYFQCTSLGFFPDTRNCRKYFFCDLNSNGYVLYHMLCPRGRIFDPTIRECRLRELMSSSDVSQLIMNERKMKRHDRWAKTDGQIIKYKDGDGTATGVEVSMKQHRKTKRNPKKVRRKSMKYNVNEPNTGYEFKQYDVKDDSPNDANYLRINNNKTNEEQTKTTPNNCNDTPGSLPVIVPVSLIVKLPKMCGTTNKTVCESNTVSEISTTTLSPSSTTSPGSTCPTCPPRPRPENKQTQMTSSLPCTTALPSSQAVPATTIKTTQEMSKTTNTPKSEEDTTRHTQSESKKTTKKIITTMIFFPELKENGKEHKSFEEYYLDSDSYQDYTNDDDYVDDYYSDNDSLESEYAEDYNWLRKNFHGYINKMKPKGDGTVNINMKITPQHQAVNDNNENRQKKQDKSKIFSSYDYDRGKRSEEKCTNFTVPSCTIEDKSSEELPDFEKCYNDSKEGVNFDGYPCKRYARYPDKSDKRCYYECGAQPDGNMKIEHKCCIKGEEFSPKFLECITIEFLKLTRKKRMHEVRKSSKQRPTPEPEYNYEDEKEPSNEWLDAQPRNKLPNEFKTKGKHGIRIFHLKCRRNSTQGNSSIKNVRSAVSQNEKHQEARSYVVKSDKKEKLEDIDKGDDEEYEEYEYEDEDYDDGENFSKTSISSISSSPQASSSSTHTSTAVVESTTSSSKILLDADIRVNREFETALKSILGKNNEKDQQKDGSGDSILIRLSGEKLSERPKRNFIKSMFPKKSKNNDIPEKEGVVSMINLINGMPSEYERDAILQKLERRKMLNSQMCRNGGRPVSFSKKLISPHRRYANRNELNRDTNLT